MDVSIVICTINRAHFLTHSLFVLNKQIWDKNVFQIIIVDDGSTDDTKKVVDEYSSQLNISYIYNDKKEYSSPAKARNIGWETSKTQYICFTDPEVILPPYLLKTVYDYHMHHPNRITTVKPIMMDEVETETFFKYSDRFHWLFNRDITQFENSENEQIQKRKTWRDNHFSMMPRQALVDVNGVNESFTIWGFEGIDLIERIIDKGYPLYTVHDCVYHLWHSAPRDMNKADEQRKQYGVKNCGKQS